MPLPNNEKSARHRAKVNADPVARARYLAKRRESYQRRKREGKTKHPPVAALSKARQEKLRQKWRQYQRSHRNKIRNLPRQCSSQVEMNSQWMQEFAPQSPSSEVDSSSATLESPVSSYSWIKQEPETVVTQWDNINTLPAATETEQDNTPSSATATSMIPPINEDLPSSVMLTITKLHCLVESKQERIEALERQVQDLQEDRRFLRSQIENLTGARLVSVPEASTSVFSQSRSRKRRRKSSSTSYIEDESITDESSSEESSSVRKKKRHKKKGKRGCVPHCD